MWVKHVLKIHEKNRSKFQLVTELFLFGKNLSRCSSEYMCDVLGICEVYALLHIYVRISDFAFAHFSTRLFSYIRSIGTSYCIAVFFVYSYDVERR